MVVYTDFWKRTGDEIIREKKEWFCPKCQAFTSDVRGAGWITPVLTCRKCGTVVFIETKVKKDG